MNSPISHLTDVLQKVRDSANTYESQLQGNESATRAALIDPVLRALGWDIANPGRVLVEKTQTVEKKQLRVDYALLHENKIKIVVEAKKLGGNLQEHFLQLVTYSFGLSVESIFVSDGRIWQHYQNLSFNNQNPTREFDISANNLPEVAAYLVQHMDAALISPETPKIDELSQRVEKMENLFLELKDQVDVNKTVVVDGKSKIAPKIASPSPPKSTIDSIPSAKEDNWYSINDGTKKISSKAVNVTVDSLKELAALVPDFFAIFDQESIAFRTKGKSKGEKRRWIAHSREELYQKQDPKLLQASRQLDNDWWLGTNYGNAQKRDMLNVAKMIADRFNIKFEFELE